MQIEEHEAFSKQKSIEKRERNTKQNTHWKNTEELNSNKIIINMIVFQPKQSIVDGNYSITTI